MVNTIVTFGNNRLSSTTPPPVVVRKPNDQYSLQRQLYLIVGIVILTIILLPNIFAIRTDREDFTYHLLFIVHSCFLMLFFVSTMLYSDIGDGIATICSLVLLAIYKTIHYLIRYRHCQVNSRNDFLITTIQLTVLLIFVITYVLWTYLLIRTNNRLNRNKPTNQRRIFSSVLGLTLMLTVSCLILNIPNQDAFGLHHIIILSVGISFALLWCTTGILMSIYENCLCITSFYFLSIIPPFHLAYLMFQSVNEFRGLSHESAINQYLPLLIITCICVSTNVLAHFFVTIIGCWMISKTDQPIVNTRWMLTSI